MNILSLILGVIAIVLFVLEAIRTRAIIPWGFAAFAAMVMAQWLIETGDPLTF